MLAEAGQAAAAALGIGPPVARGGAGAAFDQIGGVLA
jgi:hypothetical protein